MKKQKKKAKVMDDKQLQDKLDSLLWDLQRIPGDEVIKSLEWESDDYDYAQELIDKLKRILAEKPDANWQTAALLKQWFDEAEDKQRLYNVIRENTYWVGLTAGGGC